MLSFLLFHNPHSLVNAVHILKGMEASCFMPNYKPLLKKEDCEMTKQFLRSLCALDGIGKRIAPCFSTVLKTQLLGIKLIEN